MGIVHMSTAVVSYCTMLLYEYEGKGTREGFQVVFSSLLFVLGGVFRLAHLHPFPAVRYCCTWYLVFNGYGLPLPTLSHMRGYAPQ